MSDQNPIVDIKFNITESGAPEVSNQSDHTTDTGGAASDAANKIADKVSAKTAFVNPFAGGVNPFAPPIATQDSFEGSTWASMGRIPKIGRVEPSPIEPPKLASEPPKPSIVPTGPVEKFTTSFGSTYEIKGKGTTRTKSNGETLEASDTTRYVSKDHAQEILDYVDAAISGPLSYGKKNIGLGSDTDISPARKIPFSTTPKVGLIPIESWKDRNIEVGHEITEVTRRVTPQPTTEDPLLSQEWLDREAAAQKAKTDYEAKVATPSQTSMFAKLLGSKVVGDPPLSLTDRPNPVLNSDGTNSRFKTDPAQATPLNKGIAQDISGASSISPSEEAGKEGELQRERVRKENEALERRNDRILENRPSRPDSGTPEAIEMHAKRAATNRQIGIDAGNDPDADNQFKNPFTSTPRPKVTSYSYPPVPPPTPPAPYVYPPYTAPIIPPLIPPGGIGSSTPPPGGTPPTPTPTPTPPTPPPTPTPVPTPPTPPTPPPTPPPSPPGGGGPPGGPPGGGGGGPPGGFGGAAAGAAAGAAGAAAGGTGASVGAMGGALAGMAGGSIAIVDAGLSVVLAPFHRVTRDGIEPMLRALVSVTPVIRHFQAVMESVDIRYRKDQQIYGEVAPMFHNQMLMNEMNLKFSRFSSATATTGISENTLDQLLAERSRINTQWQQNSENFGAELSKLLYREINPISQGMTNVQGEISRTGKGILQLLGSIEIFRGKDEKGLIAVSLDGVSEALKAFNDLFGLDPLVNVEDIQKQLRSDLDAIFNGPDLNGRVPGKGRIPQKRKAPKRQNIPGQWDPM